MARALGVCLVFGSGVLLVCSGKIAPTLLGVVLMMMGLIGAMASRRA